MFRKLNLHGVKTNLILDFCPYLLLNALDSQQSVNAIKTTELQAGFMTKGTQNV